MNLIQISSFKKNFLATLLYHRFMLSLKYLNTFFFILKKQDIYFFFRSNHFNAFFLRTGIFAHYPEIRLKRCI